MSSPLNDPSVDQWFRRFDAAAKHLPSDDRAAQHEELRQHLDALAAANVASGQSPELAQQNALTRLGDPSQIGRKLDREWQQSRTGFRADIRAIGFGVTLWAVCECLLNYLVWPLVEKHPTLVDFRLLAAGSSIRIVIDPSYWVVLAIGTAIGLKYPHQALKSALVWPFFWPLLSWGHIAWSILTSNSQHWTRLPDGDNLAFALFNMILFCMPQIIWSLIIAYLASVTRRGWYRPTLADFKVSLPQKKARA